MAEQKLGNPAVVGLAGFGLTTMMLQFHNVGWMGIGPVIWLGLIFGGFAQMVAGLQEMKSGNNFGYCAVYLLRLLLDITGPDSHWQSLQYLRFQQNRHWMVSGRLDCVQHNSLDRIDAYQQRVGADVYAPYDRLRAAGFCSLRIPGTDRGGRLRIDGLCSDGLVHHGSPDICGPLWSRRAAGRKALDLDGVSLPADCSLL